MTLYRVLAPVGGVNSAITAYNAITEAALGARTSVVSDQYGPTVAAPGS